MSFLDILSNIGGAAMQGDPKGAMDSAIYGIQNEMGKFLSSGQTILNIKTRARAYISSKNYDVALKAQAVVSKSDSLLANIQTIQSNGGNVLSQASAIRAKMDSDPLWRNILTADWNSLGYESIKVARNMIGQSSGLVGDLAGIVKQMNSHMNQTASLQNDMSALDDLAQGRGIKGTLSQIGGLGSIGSGVKEVAIIGVVAVIGIMLLPEIIGGIARGARKATQK